MTFTPVQRMLERVDLARADSDTSLFFDLLGLAELVAKILTASVVAAIADDKDRTRYGQLHRLVRADGIGEWAAVLDETVSGPPSQGILPEARPLLRELSEKCPAGTWQFEAVSRMHECLLVVGASPEALPAKPQLKTWFAKFATLRNKTRGHGACPSRVLADACVPLEASVRRIIDNSAAFSASWAYLHRNLNGKYRVTPLTDVAAAFGNLKSTTQHNFPDGVYVHLGRPVRVDLVDSDVDASDFVVANGGFGGDRYEMLSYATGQTRFAESSAFRLPPTQLPSSETAGLGELDAVGACFTNLPKTPVDYIQRPVSEAALREFLHDDYRRIVTLIGRGGIGKTSLALACLDRIAREGGRFEVIVWLSARDLDLLPQGPKRVRPDVIDHNDIAREYARLLQPDEAGLKSFRATDFLARELGEAAAGPTLFVLDNFETVSSPPVLYQWIDSHIRPPNKVLITTRHRDFSGDYPIEVGGMSDSECERLIESVARRLRIQELLTSDYIEDVIRESEGHPYVMKILLGEVAKTGMLRKVERIVAESDAILDALFERTFLALSPAAQRVFLTVCGWRSAVPRVGLEAILLRAANERIAARDAIEELQRSSFIESLESSEDGQMFIAAPLVARLFGQRKLLVSPMKTAIQADVDLLRAFGPTTRPETRQGFAPRLRQMVRHVARKGAGEFEQYIPILEFIACSYPGAWLELATMYEESSQPDGMDRAIYALRRYLESGTQEYAGEVWTRLAEICRRTGDTVGELQALIEAAECTGASLEAVSAAANRVNNLFRVAAVDSSEKHILVRRLVDAMAANIGRGTATDYSRLAWLCLHLKDAVRARKYVAAGLQLDPTNEHCVRLEERLSAG
ncbi:MAG: hypothetical protein IT379_38035 [Deltaproteobacteria bacterium]|nr:hypothetical protein [Deltaproteobacteria bacterium]